MQDRAGGDVFVVGDEDPPFPGVHVFEGLPAKSCRHTEPARRRAIPRGAKCMGAVFDHRNAEIIRGPHHPIHVRQVTAHVGQHQHLGASVLRLCVQIIDIDVIVLVDLYKDRRAAGMGDGPRHRRQRERIDQNLLARLDTD